MRNTVDLAVGVQKLAPADASPGLQGILGIVQSSMDNLGVSRARFAADGGMLLQDHGLATSRRKLSCNGQANHARANDYAIERWTCHIGSPRTDGMT